MTGRSPAISSAFRLTALVLSVAAAYYAGGALGFALKLPHATPSVLWMPNAILTCTLLLTRRRLWPAVFAAAFVAHVLVERGANFPMPLVVALFATNCSEALIAAVGLQWLSDSPLRFDSLRRVGIFIGVVVIAAPLLSSFLDAAAVRWIRDEPYWMVWRARLFSNILSALIVVPAVITTATSAWAWLTTAQRSRQVEALLFAASLLVVAIIVLGPEGSAPMARTLADRAPLALLLPFLVWAAVRFGPGGASVTVLASALAATGASVYSRGPFEGLSPAHTTLALQLYVTVISVTVLGVAALVEERKVVQQDLSDRLAFEALLARLSQAFVHVPSDCMSGAFDEWLRRVGEFFALDRMRLYQHVDTEQELTSISHWTVGGVSPGDLTMVRREFPWALDRVLHGHSVILSEAIEFPPEAARDRQSFEQYGFKSSVAIPLIAGERVLGALTFASMTTPQTWPSALIAQLQLIAEVFGNALARKQSEDFLRTSEMMKSSILASLTNGVVVVDRDGCIIAVNGRWRRFAGDDAPRSATEVGANHLEYYDACSRAGHLWAADAVAGIELVMHGTQHTYALEYERTPDRWFVMRVVPLNRPEGGVVITHTDVSGRKRAEIEAHQMRGELAHVSRVSTMGALTASLAHQLNQPLTGILTNAQAAQRFLQADTPDLAELRATLGDIIHDSRRARDVIVRVRDFLRKGDGSAANVDMNALVTDVARFMNSDALMRDAVLELRLQSVSPLARGNRVQLQQVVLNLIVNAFEAVADRAPGTRIVVVQCAPGREGFLDLSVTDSGPGFSPGSEDLAFEAFYTTKRNGMGMGLSIARSIVEAHGGVIRATNNSGGGAIILCTLPQVYPVNA